MTSMDRQKIARLNYMQMTLLPMLVPTIPVRPLNGFKLNLIDSRDDEGRTNSQSIISKTKGWTYDGPKVSEKMDMIWISLGQRK